MPLDAQQRRNTESWFVSRGVPHFIAEYSATEDVLTRALPLLTLIFLFSSVSAIDLDWPPWGIVAAIIGGFAVLVTAWALLNRLRSRPRFAMPSKVGGVEIGAFLLIPALLPLIFGGDVTGAFVTFAVQLGLLLLVYAITSYAIFAMAWWAVGQLWRSLGQTLSLFARGLPLLLLGFMFLFINAEAWQSAGRLETPLLLAILGLFVVLGGLFLAVQIPRELSAINEFTSWPAVREACGPTALPAGAIPEQGTPETHQLSRREWANVGLVILVSQSLRIALLSVLVGGFFLVFGVLVIRPDTIELWTMSNAVRIGPTVGWFGIDLQLTEELVRVAVFLASFAGLYFSVYSITDATFRREFFEDTLGEMREALAVRTVYLESA